MSYEESIKSISLDADSSLGIYTGVPGQPGSASPNGGKQYCAVKITGAHQVGLQTTASVTKVLGVLQNKPQRPGEAATVCIFGVSNVLTGATAFAAGDYLTTDTSGRFVPNGTSGSTTATNVMALAPSTGANQLAPALIRG